MIKEAVHMEKVRLKGETKYKTYYFSVASQYIYVEVQSTAIQTNWDILFQIRQPITWCNTPLKQIIHCSLVSLLYHLYCYSCFMTCWLIIATISTVFIKKAIFARQFIMAHFINVSIIIIIFI